MVEDRLEKLEQKLGFKTVLGTFSTFVSLPIEGSSHVILGTLSSV